MRACVCVCVYYCTNTTKSSDLITICYSFVGVKTTVRLFCNKNRFKAKLKVKKEDANLDHRTRIWMLL